MRRILFTLLVLLFASEGKAQFYWKDLAEEPIDKRIREISEWKIENEDTVLFNIKTYNEKGFKIKEEGYYPGIEQPQYSYFDYTYDEENRMILKKEVYRDLDLEEETTRTFDYKKLSFREEKNTNGKYAGHILKQYSKKQMLQSIKCFNPEKKYDWNSIYEYNGNNQQIAYAHSTESGKLAIIHTSRYDNKKHQIENLFYNKDSSFSQGHYYEYDKKGRMITDTYKSELMPGNNYILTYEYDPGEKGYSIYRNDETKAKWLAERNYSNENGWTEKRELFDVNGNVTLTYVYEYKTW